MKIRQGLLAATVVVGFLNHYFLGVARRMPSAATGELVLKIAAIAILVGFLFRIGLGQNAGIAALFATQVYLCLLVPGVNPALYLPAAPFRDIMAVVASGLLFGLLSIALILQCRQRLQRPQLVTLLAWGSKPLLLGLVASLVAMFAARGMAWAFTEWLPSTLGRTYFAYPAAIAILLAVLLGYLAGQKLNDPKASILLTSILAPLGALLGCAWVLLSLHWLLLPPRYYFGLQLTHLIGFVVAYHLACSRGPSHHACYIAAMTGSLGAVTHWALFLYPHRGEFLPWLGLGLLVTVACHFLVLDRSDIWELLRRL